MGIKDDIRNGFLTLDGALGTQLEEKIRNNGSLRDIQSHPLWSALVLVEEPEKIQQVHYDYLKSGANIILTSTYQASKRGLIKYSEDIKSDEDVARVYKTAMNVALKAKKQYQNESLDPERRIYICGSVGPFGGFLSNGAEYTGDYVGHINSPEELKDFHSDTVEFYMSETECDLIGFETVPNYEEIQQILTLMDEAFLGGSKPFYLSMNFKNSNQLCDGTEIEKVFHQINDFLNKSERLKSNLVAVGCNCIQLDGASDVIESIANNNKVHDIPLIVYPNAGLKYDLTTGTYIVESTEREVWETLCKRWAEEFNVKIIGACCGSNPDIIKFIHSTLEALKT